MGTRPHWTYNYQIWCEGSRRRRNHWWQILSRSVKGLPVCGGPKMGSPIDLGSRPYNRSALLCCLWCMLRPERCCIARSCRRTIVTFLLISHKHQLWSWNWIYHQKAHEIELSSDMFAEQKCCQVFTHESETFHRRRPNGICHCENGNTNPQNLPYPRTMWTTI